MTNGTSALSLDEKTAGGLVPHPDPAARRGEWSFEQHLRIVEALKAYGCEYLNGREEYTLLKEIVTPDSVTEVTDSGKSRMARKPLNIRAEGSGVISPICVASSRNDTTEKVRYRKPFLAPMDLQKAGSIAQVIPSFRVIQSDSICLNIGFDTEFQDSRDGSDGNRRVLSLQMSVALGDTLIRYFFLVTPRYQEIGAEGGLIPLKYCLADILADLKKNHFPDLPLVLKRELIYKEKPRKNHEPFRTVDFAAMRDKVIPVTLICHTGKADISVFRRSKYDIDLLRSLGEIQGGWMTTEHVRLKAENDRHYNYYWLVSLSVRDTLGLTPAENKSLKALGNVIGRPKIELPPGAIRNMGAFIVSNPVEFYKYAVNDADIVVSFCAELFQCNHAVPMTLSSAAASSMYGSIKEYFGVKNKAEYDRKYRGLEMLDEGLIPSEEECMKFLKATRYVPIRDNPDARLVSEYFEEAYTGGFNASFFIGWITEQTTDFDLQNAYPTAMANIVDIDWSKNVRDFPRNYELSLLLTMFLSLLFNNSIATMGFVFAFVLADLFLAVPTKWRMLSQIRYLTPISVLLNTRVQDLRLTKLFGIYLNPFETAPILYILCSAFFIIISIPIFYRRCISD